MVTTKERIMDKAYGPTGYVKPKEDDVLPREEKKAYKFI